MDSSEITAIIVAIIGVIGVIVSNRRRSDKPPLRPDPWLIGICFFILVTMAAVSFLGWQHCAPTRLKIVYPSNNSMVNLSERIQGSSTRIPKEHAVWVIVMPHEVNRYYPQDSEASVQKNGIWNSLAHIGIEEDAGKGKTFHIIAVLADKAAQDSFRAYLAHGKEKGWSGMENLPQGATQYDSVIVTRK
jgi:hypothetical protein